MRDALLKLLAGRRGHFGLESGYHAEWWYDLRKLFAHPKPLQPFVAELAHRLAVHRPNVICGPKAGGADLARAVAAELGVTAWYTERREPKDAGGFFSV